MLAATRRINLPKPFEQNIKRNNHIRIYGKRANISNTTFHLPAEYHFGFLVKCILIFSIIYFASPTVTINTGFSFIKKDMVLQFA